ncbi:MAG: LON peptidase substrate-binding domain-containing protein [Actinomycetota bacterium]
MELSPDDPAVPMFPLGRVLLPFEILPLHVFEPRYRALVRDVLDTSGEFGVVLIERGREVGGGDIRFDVGTLARIVRVERVPDGRFGLVTVGVRRVRVREWQSDDPYPRAVVEPFAEPALGPDAEAAVPRVAARLAEVAALARQFDPRVADPPSLADDPVRASWEAAAIAPLGPLDAQRVLETESAEARLAVLEALLAEHAAALRFRLGPG